MKKKVLKSISVMMSLLTLFVQTQAFGNTTRIHEEISGIDVAVFNLDESELDVAMQELNELESYLEVHPEFTYSDVKKNAVNLVSNLSATSAPAGSGDAPLGIPSFLWGCVFGVLGIILVYLITDKNMDETKKALWGCLAGTGAMLILYFTVFATTAAAASSTY